MRSRSERTAAALEYCGPYCARNIAHDRSGIRIDVQKDCGRTKLLDPGKVPGRVGRFVRAVDELAENNGRQINDLENLKF